MGHGEDLGESGLRRAPGPGADQPELWKGRPPSAEALQWLSHFRTSSSPILSCLFLTLGHHSLCEELTLPSSRAASCLVTPPGGAAKRGRAGAAGRSDAPSTRKRPCWGRGSKLRPPGPGRHCLALSPQRTGHTAAALKCVNRTERDQVPGCLCHHRDQDQHSLSPSQHMRSVWCRPAFQAETLPGSTCPSPQSQFGTWPTLARDLWWLRARGTLR